ncbi:MAG: GNAT family N-acetyltransferase [Azospirillaceae bacterium]
MSSPAESPSAAPDAAPNRSAGRASPVLRPGEDRDADDLIALVGTCFAEYPGCVLDVDGEIPELRAIATWAAGGGGAFWCVEHDGRVVASVGAMPLAGGGDGPAIELVKLYVLPEARGTGLARRLVGAVEDHARATGAGRIELWTDTRFTTAHRVYERLGYRRTARTRAIPDKSDTVEFHYIKALRAAENAVAGPGRAP